MAVNPARTPRKNRIHGGGLTLEESTLSQVRKENQYNFGG